MSAKLFNSHHSMRIKVTFGPQNYINLKIGYDGESVSGAFANYELARKTVLALQKWRKDNIKKHNNTGDMMVDLTERLQNAKNTEDVLNILSA